MVVAGVTVLLVADREAVPLVVVAVNLKWQEPKHAGSKRNGETVLLLEWPFLVHRPY